jgi:signal transduction histidine kinase
MTTRTLLTLPALVEKSARWQLPMCDATALVLVDTALQDDPVARAAQLEAALAIDPALLIWVVWHATAETARLKSAVVPQTLSSLVQWLAPRLYSLLDWKTDPQCVEITADQHGRYAALVAESVCAAHDAVRTLGSHAVLAEPSFLAALTGGWRQWLTASQSSGSAAEPGIVWPWAVPPAPATVSPEARVAGDEAWRHWLSEIPAAQFVLPKLISQLRRLNELESSFDKRLQTAKLDSLKEFAYGAGHELNNPLANIASRAQTLLKEETHPERRRRLAAINTQAFRAHEMLADMMLFARPPQPMLAEVDLVPLVDEVLDGVAEMADHQQTALHGPTRREPFVVQADGVQLRVALRALCINALEAMQQGGNITIEICRSEEAAANGEAAELQSDAGQNDLAQIVVSDDGPGIAAEIREKIFDPFFSGREAGRGLGFGLSKCWRIVTLHGGRMDVESAPGQGATLTISLPLGANSTAAAGV